VLAWAPPALALSPKAKKAREFPGAGLGAPAAGALPQGQGGEGVSKDSAGHHSFSAAPYYIFWCFQRPRRKRMALAAAMTDSAIRIDRNAPLE
jgi:hypothetical protein